MTGAHRTWLDPSGRGKAPIDTPRRAMGDLLGNAVRFGVANDVLAAGEASRPCCRCVVCCQPFRWPPRFRPTTSPPLLLPLTLRRLYIAPRRRMRPATPAVIALTERAEAVGIEAIAWSPRLGDFNEDLRTFGPRRTSGNLAHPARGGRTSSASCCGRATRRGECRRFKHLHGRSGEAQDAGQSPRLGLLEGDRTASGPARQWLRPAIFAGPCGPLQRETKIAGLRILRWRCGPSLRCGSGPIRPPSGDRHEGRDGRGRSGKGPHHDEPTMTTPNSNRRTPPPRPITSSTKLQLYGYRPFHDEPDPRPLPEGDACRGRRLRHLRTPWSRP